MKRIYEDKENNVIFFNLTKYMDSIKNSVLKQNRQKSYFIQREISIHRLYNHTEEQVNEILKKNPKITKIYKIERLRGGSAGAGYTTKTDYVAERGYVVLTKDWDRVRVDEFKIFRSRKKR